MAQNAPLITNVSYNGTHISVWWTPSADPAVTGYNVTVSYGASPDAATAVFSASTGKSITFADIPLDCYQLDSNVNYFVQVTTQWSSGPGQNESSQLVPLITDLPETLSAHYDGSNLNFRWVGNKQAVQGYVLKATAVDGGSTYSTSLSSPSATSGMIPAASLPAGGLDPTVEWQVSVCAVGNMASNDPNCQTATGCSPWLNLPKPLPKIALGAASYLPSGTLNASWTPLTAAAGISSYRLTVTGMQDGSVSDFLIPDVTLGTASVQLSPPLASGQGYILRLIALNAAGGGVSTAPFPLITAGPQLTGINYDTSKGILFDWLPLSNPLISSYTVEVFSTSGAPASYTAVVPGSTAVSGAVPIPKGGFNSAQTWAARVWANAASVVVAIGGSAPVFIATPVLQSVSAAGSELTVSWTPISLAAFQSADGYQVRLTPAAGGAPVASVFVNGSASSSAVIRAPETGDYNVQLALFGGLSTGPVSAAVQAINTVAVVSAVTTDAVTGLTTLSWGKVSGAAAYLLSFSSGAAPVSVAAPLISYTIPAATQPANLPLSVTISAQASVAGVAIKGANTKALDVPSRQVTVTAAGMNGQTATVAWTALSGVSAYSVSIVEVPAGGTGVVAANKVVASPAVTATLALTPVKNSVYSAVVQAVYGAIGPTAVTGAVSVTTRLFQPAFFPSATPHASAYPFVYPATNINTVLDPDTAKTGEALTLYLPQFGPVGGFVGLPVVQGAFTLAANPDTHSVGAYPYVLNISNVVAANNPWAFGAVAPAIAPAPIRNGVRSDYIAFLQAVEAKQAQAWGIVYLQQVLARYLPQTLPELLYYNFGLTFPDAVAGFPIGSADLRPGMVLRVSSNPYQMVAGATSSSWNNGYVAGSTVDYDIGSMVANSGAWSVGYDPFIGQLAANGAITVSPPLSNADQNLLSGGADGSDLYFGQFSGPFYRLFIPGNLQSPSGTFGSIIPAQNFVMAPAATFTALSSTTNALTASGNALAYFRGRAIVKLCIRVRYNAVELTVPIGTTVGNLLERGGALPAAVNMPLSGIRLDRSLGGGVTNPGAGLSAAMSSVRLDWHGAGAQPYETYGPNWNVLSMPLLPGDVLTTG